MRYDVVDKLPCDTMTSVPLCCPHGYSNDRTECPYSVDRNYQCCNRLGFWNYSVVDKIPCHVAETSVIIYELSENNLKQVNPLSFFGGNNELHTDGKLNVAGLINRTLSFIFPLAGLALFLMLVWGGFEMLTGTASKKNLDAGKERVTAAIIGFLLLFISYWIVQIVEYVTGVGILG